MVASLRQFPAFVLLLLAAAGLMLIPASQAAMAGQWPVARAFLYHAIFLTIVGIIIGIATRDRLPRVPARYHLMTLLLAYALLPVALAMPLREMVPQLGFGAAYFEMLSCLTTTGASVFDRPRLLPDALHLWRGLVGWAGGFIILVTAFAILAPINLGGFEIRRDMIEQTDSGRRGSIDMATQRILKYAGIIGPVYAVCTGILALALILLGDRPLVAAIHAMSTLSTSGISPVGGVDGTGSGRLGEMTIALFLLPAVTYRFVYVRHRRGEWPGLSDPEIQLMLICVLGVTALLFLRSFIGAVDIERQDNLAAAAQAIWGSLFTVLSFLTTTGFVSHDWRAMQLWSGLPDPGIMLLGVAVMGGGIATTAGGIKLLRLYALYRHGIVEMDVLVHPTSIARHGRGDRHTSARGSRIAFVFLMLFLSSVGLSMIALSALNLDFDTSLTLSIAALTTTGPAILTLGTGLGYGDLGSGARYILCIGMIVGRMEALVLLALFNPAYWRQ